MRILIDALTFDERDGGFATVLKSLVKAVSKISEFEFVVGCHDNNRHVFEPSGIEICSISFPFRARWYLAPFLIERLARRVHADVIHHEISAPSPVRAIPFSIMVHDLHFLSGDHVRRQGVGGFAMDHYWRNYFTPSLKDAARIKAVSKTTRNDVLSRCPHIHAANIDCIYPAIARLHLPAKPRIYPEQRPLNILFLGSIVPRKNLSFLLRALRSVQRPWRLSIVGNVWWGAPELDDWRSDDRVQVHGYLDLPELAQVCEAAHLFVSPATYEGFGLPCAEAMSSGLPVLASDIPAHREFVPDECLFQLNDTSELTRTLNELDATRYQELLSGLPRIVDQFSEARYIASHAKFFRDAFVTGVRS